MTGMCHFAVTGSVSPKGRLFHSPVRPSVWRVLFFMGRLSGLVTPREPRVRCWGTYVLSSVSSSHIFVPVMGHCHAHQLPCGAAQGPRDLAQWLGGWLCTLLAAPVLLSHRAVSPLPWTCLLTQTWSPCGVASWGAARVPRPPGQPSSTLSATSSSSIPWSLTGGHSGWRAGVGGAPSARWLLRCVYFTCRVGGVCII